MRALHLQLNFVGFAASGWPWIRPRKPGVGRLLALASYPISDGGVLGSRSIREMSMLPRACNVCVQRLNGYHDRHAGHEKANTPCWHPSDGHSSAGDEQPC